MSTGEAHLKYEMVRAIVGEILARPDCPKEVTRDWENYHEFWKFKGGHWNDDNGTESYMWKDLMDSLRRAKLLPEAFKEIPK